MIEAANNQSRSACDGNGSTIPAAGGRGQKLSVSTLLNPISRASAYRVEIKRPLLALKADLRTSRYSLLLALLGPVPMRCEGPLTRQFLPAIMGGGTWEEAHARHEAAKVRQPARRRGDGMANRSAGSDVRRFD